jgi:predicted phage tail protein
LLFLVARYNKTFDQSPLPFLLCVVYSTGAVAGVRVLLTPKNRGHTVNTACDNYHKYYYHGKTSISSGFAEPVCNVYGER